MTSFGVEHLTVELHSTRAIDDLTLTVSARDVAAVVGGDGAGKSTLLRVLAGALRPGAGRVLRPAARRLGYVPTGAGTFPDLSLAENLDFVARAFGLERRDARRRGEALLERTGLRHFTTRLAGRLSGGQRQKLALVLALLPDPELLVLDEPTTGIDPVSRAELWQAISAAAADGAAVVVATAYLDEAERAGTVVVLDRGRAVLRGTPDELVRGIPGCIVEVDEPRDRHRAWRRGRRFREWIPDGGRARPDARVRPDLEDAAVVAALAERTGAGA